MKCYSLQYIQQALNWKESVRVMLTILVNLRQQVKGKGVETEVEQVKPEEEPSSRKKKKMRSELQSISENDENVPCMY